jgi:methyltransferase
VDPRLPFAALIVGTGAMRLVELAVSVRRIRARPQHLVHEPRLFPAMAALHTALVVLPLAEVWLLDRAFSWAVAGPALGILAAATALRVWTLATIGGAWNVRVVRPDEHAVATTGPYRYIRHPNYLCVVLELFALPLVHGAWASSLVLTLGNAAVLAVRVPTEERALMQVEAWRRAFEHRARFLPGLF